MAYSSNSQRKTTSYSNILYALIVFVTFGCGVLSGCSDNKPVVRGKVGDPQKTPSLIATDISTVISDSGITRYRITTPRMLIFDRAERSHWFFPKGLHFEQTHR